MITQLLFTPEVIQPVTHYLVWYLVGVVAFPITIGIAGRLAGRRLNTPPARMAVASLLWPASVWGAIAATIADNIANS